LHFAAIQPGFIQWKYMSNDYRPSVKKPYYLATTMTALFFFKCEKSVYLMFIDYFRKCCLFASPEIGA